MAGSGSGWAVGSAGGVAIALVAAASNPPSCPGAWAGLGCPLFHACQSVAPAQPTASQCEADHETPLQVQQWLEVGRVFKEHGIRTAWSCLLRGRLVQGIEGVEPRCCMVRFSGRVLIKAGPWVI